MSSVGSVSGSGGSWPSVSDRFSQMNAKLFANIDADGDGSIDKSELQAAFDKIAAATGGTSLKADDLFSAIDTDGDGKVSASDLEAGVKSLLPEPSSTVDFAAQRGQRRSDELFAKLDSDGSGDLDASELQTMLDKKAQHDPSSQAGAGSGLTGADLLKKLDSDGDGKVSKAEFAAGRPQHAHGGKGAHAAPPPAGAAAAPASQSTSGPTSSTSATSTDPADTNGDGVVSAQERAAADLKALLAGLLAATESLSAGSAASSSSSLSVHA